MDARGAAPGGGTPPGDWPADPETALALNHTGCFDWDLDRGVVHLDAAALDILDLRAEDFTGDPAQVSAQVPPAEASRIDLLVSQALKSGRSSYGTYFRLRRENGAQCWGHTQGHVLREPDGRPHRIIGIIRDATGELDQPPERLTLDADASRHTSVVERTTAALAHARTVDEVLEALDQSQGLQQLGAADVMVGMIEGARMRLFGKEHAYTYPSPDDYTRTDDSLPMNEVARTLTPRFIVSREEFAVRYPQLWPLVERLEVSAAAYLPLIAQARPIGALGLLYRNKHVFTAEERDLLTALSSTLSQSLQRALLFEQEHELAEGLQRAMLPHSVPHVPGVRHAVRYRAAQQGRDIGGDWYDVIPLPGGRVAAVVGDIEGHDTHAAAVMGQLRIVLRAYAAEGHTAPTVMARASAFLEDLETDRLATCLYAEVDPASGWVRLVRAGHLVPLLRRPDGECRPFPVLGALPLGLPAHLGRTEYPVTTMELEPGETLLMFTDGLVEQPGGDIELEIEKLARTVGDAPHDLEELAETLYEPPAAWRSADDMALVLLHRESTAGSGPGRRLHQEVSPGDPAGLAAVRQMVQEAAESWQSGDRADDVVLVTDELVTNALLHTGSGATVTVYPLGDNGDRVRVEVTDLSSAHPQLREPADNSLSGRGLLLVDQLADVWGVESRGGGKSVWCEFADDGADDPGADDPGPGGNGSGGGE
jgi:PAS domain S-box-containing protein